VSQPRGPVVTLRGQRLILDLPWLVPALILAFATGWFLPEIYFETSSITIRVLGVALVPIALALALAIVEYSRADSACRYGVTGSRRLYPGGSVSTGFELPSDPGSEFRRHLRSVVIPALIALVPGLVGYIAGTTGALNIAANVAGLIIAGVAILNIVPAIPFAGGELFRTLFWYLHDGHNAGTRAAFLYSQLTVSGSLAFGVFFLLWRPETLLPGFWCLFLGWMVVRASRSELVRAHLISRASHVRAADAVSGLNPTIRSSASLMEAIDILLEQKQNGPALVRDRNVYVGMLNLEIARSVPRANWDEMSASDVLMPFGELNETSAGTTLLEALRAQGKLPGSTIIVRDDSGRISGLIDDTMDPLMLVRRGMARDVRAAAEERSSREGKGTS
jgi:hypothetical protein